jgi:hypothetical protein
MSFAQSPFGLLMPMLLMTAFGVTSAQLKRNQFSNQRSHPTNMLRDAV